MDTVPTGVSKKKSRQFSGSTTLWKSLVMLIRTSAIQATPEIATTGAAMRSMTVVAARVLSNCPGRANEWSRGM